MRCAALGGGLYESPSWDINRRYGLRIASESRREMGYQA
jgi:hypothetical protein